MENEKKLLSRISDMSSSNSELKPQWLFDEGCQAALRSMRAVAFEYNVCTGEQSVSPYIGEYVSGAYDGRPMSTVMIEDEVIYQEDLEVSLEFREKIKHGEPGEMTIRLLSAEKEYRWYRMSITSCKALGRGVFVGILADVDKEKKQEEALRRRAEYDSVSGIYNKETFIQMTEDMLESEKDKPRYLINLDIDRFKIINEIYSVSQGDKVLRYLGEVIEHLSRPGESYGRIRDDVFAVCLNRSEKETLEWIKEVERHANDFPFLFHFVLAIGILYIPRYEGESVRVLCDRAAMARKTVKGNYFRRYAFYEKAMSENLNREYNLTGCMRQSLENGEFFIELQPKFEMEGNWMIGGEALVRWNHPVYGRISPGDFIPLFERNGFILHLDEYVWECTCKLIRSWIDKGMKPVPISVNVSRTHLYDPDFCSHVVSLCEKYSIDPELLELEITESAYIECPQNLYGIMDKLQERGFVFSMDDFGSGYSSLNVLKDIPVNIVKIDLNFLRDARRGVQAGRTVLEGTIRLVRSMELPIIAEGVETKEQAEFLKKAGCTGAQGFYYARPLAPEKFEELLCECQKRNNL